MLKNRIVLNGARFFLELMTDYRYIPHLVEWSNDTKVTANITPNSMPNTIEKWERTIGSASENNQGFIIISTENNIVRPIGFTYFYPINRSLETATSGVIIGRKGYWRKKFGMEVMRVMLDYGFSELGVKSVTGNINESNIASIKLHKRLGYRFAGKSPDKPGQTIYIITKEAWKNKRSEILKILAARSI